MQHSEDANINLNAEWVNGKGVWLIYLSAIIGFRFLCGLLFESASSWTLVAAVHCTVSLRARSFAIARGSLVAGHWRRCSWHFS